MARLVCVFAIAAASLLASCEAVCGCSPPPPLETVYGRVESTAGDGIPTAVVLYRVAADTACAFDDIASPHGEIDVEGAGRFREVIFGIGYRVECLELRAFDPAAGKADTTFILILADFADPDSTGVVLRLP